MSLLLDVFGYLSVILHGLTIVGQSIAVGSIIFLAVLARPAAGRLGASGPDIERACVRIGARASVALLVAALLGLGLQLAVLRGTLQLPMSDLLDAPSSRAALGRIAAIAGMVLLLAFCRRPPSLVLLGLCLPELAAATLATHAAGRVDHRPLLLAIEWLHQLGAAVWIGGLPCFLATMARARGGAEAALIGAGFSQLSIAGVFCILASGIGMSWFYVGAWSGFYGTAYGIMVGAKIAMLGMLLLLGAGNFMLVRRLRRDAQTDTGRLRRFVEVELGIGITVFFAAASLTSVPPAADQLADRVTWNEIVDRNTPRWPRLRSPDHDTLALPALQATLDRAAAARSSAPQAAFTPGAGVLPPRNADDIAWSEYNHHWAGLFMLLVGLLGLLQQSGQRWARHWPLVFVGLAVFLFLRADPEVWPLGAEGFFSSLRDVEVLQHRLFVLLTLVFAAFEWRVRTSRLRANWTASVFPVLTAAGGLLLLTHNHAIANIHDQVLAELTHTPLALLGVMAGWARWLELRSAPPVRTIAGWVWPVCFVLVAGLLLAYREA